MGTERFDPERVAAGIKALCYSQDNGDTWHGRVGRHFWLDRGKIVRIVLQADEAFGAGEVRGITSPIVSPFPLDLVTHWQEMFDAAMEESAGFIHRTLNGDAETS